MTTPVYDYNVVSGVDCWVIDGLVLALKDWCDPFGTLEGVLPFGVEYVPMRKVNEKHKAFRSVMRTRASHNCRSYYLRVLWTLFRHPGILKVPTF